MKLAACSRLALGPESRVWFRAFDPKHMSSPLGTAHTVSVPSRFSAGPRSASSYEILYLSANQLICLQEVQALFGSTNSSFVPNPSKTLLIINVQIELQSIADLTLEQQQRLLGTTAQELTGDWEGYHLRGPTSQVVGPTGTAPTQDLGAALFSTANVEGFRVLSAKSTGQMNLIVFPDKMQKRSRILYHDHAGKTHVIVGKV